MRLHIMDRQKILPKSKKVRRIEKFLEYCAGKDVLNIGMGGMIDDSHGTKSWINTGLKHTLHYQVVGVANKVTGVDINQLVLDGMSQECPGAYICADVMGKNFSDKVTEKYDVILFGEILEHLDCFSSALKNLRSALKEDGIIVISTPNAFAFDRVVKMLFSYEAVHLEHTCYFSYFTLKRLMNMNDLEIDEFFYHQEYKTKFQDYKHRISYNFLRIWSSIFPQYSEGLIVTVRNI